MDISPSISTQSYSRFAQDTQMRVRRDDDDGGTRVSLREHVRQRLAMGGHGRIGQHEMKHGEQATASAQTDVPTAVREAIAYERSERGTLKLRTQEGDVVRLKFVASDSVSMQGQQFGDGDNVFGDFALEASSNTRFKIAVKGDLNAEEQQAIADVLAQAGDIASSFYGGDVADAFALASDFQIDSEQLARVNMRFSVQERYAYARQSVATQTPQVADSVAAGPVASAPSNVSAAPASVPTSSAPVATTPAALTADNTQGLAQVPDTMTATPLTPATPTATAEPVATHVPADPVDHLANALATITNFLTQLSESLQGLGEDQSGQTAQTAFSFSFGFKLQIVGAMVGALDSGSEETQPVHAHHLAAATLDELAAQADAHLDDVA